MATPPRWGRRGYGRGLLGGVLDWARDDGARTGLLVASPEGELLYRACGWTVLETWHAHLRA